MTGDIIMIFTFWSLILSNYLWKLITWLFISILIKVHNFFVADAKFSLPNYWQVALNYWSAVLIQTKLINKIIKNWFNGTPIYSSDRWQRTCKKAEHTYFPYNRPCSLQMAMLRTPTCFTFYLMGSLKSISPRFKTSNLWFNSYQGRITYDGGRLWKIPVQ